MSKPFKPILTPHNLNRLLKSCTKTSELLQIHAYMIKTGLDLKTFRLSKLLASSILDMSYARSIFDQIHIPNLFMFSTMIRGYSISPCPKEAFYLFNSLRATGIPLDQFSFISTLKSCARDLAVSTGKCIHGLVIKSGFGFFVNLRNSLLHFCCSCEEIEDARQLFDEVPHIRDVVSWNSLMGGYVQTSQPRKVIELFELMHMNGFEISTTTVVMNLSACTVLRDLMGGKCVHGYCSKNGLCLDLNVVTAIIDVYAKCRCIVSARRLFEGVWTRDVILWNCMIDGYVRNGHVEESLALLQRMKLEAVKPNSSTLAGLLSASAACGSLAIGRWIHEFIEEECLELDAVLGTALIDMYSKCGIVEKAVEVFNQMKGVDVMTWTAMVAGFGLNGQAESAIELFHKMEEKGMSPNEVTFLAVLGACSHGGLVMVGKEYFYRMVRDYGFLPKVEHYGCMIDLLGRAGLLEEAHELITSLPIDKDGTAWRALLAACRVHGHVELGELAKKVLMELDDKHPTDSILLSSTYAVAGRWFDVVRMRNAKEEKGKKEAGFSSIEMAC